MRIVVSMVFTSDWYDIADITVTNTEHYCRKHGYGIIPEIMDNPYNGFQKIKSIQTLFEVGADVIWSLDCDTLITNHTISVDNFLKENKYFYITKDFNDINAGSFIIKKSKWSNSFLEYLLRQEGGDKMYCEQDAIVKFIKEFGYDNICILSHPSINSYKYELYPEIPLQTHQQGNWEQGDFILHLPGVILEKRIEIMNEYKPKIIYE